MANAITVLTTFLLFSPNGHYRLHLYLSIWRGGGREKKGRHWPSFLQNNGAILCHIDPGHLRISEGGNEGAQLLEGRHAHPARLVCQQVHKEVGQVLAPCLQRTGTGDGHEALGACLAHSPHTIATQVVEFGQLSQIDGHKKHSEHIKTTNGNFHPGFMKNSAILQLGGPLFKTNSDLSYWAAVIDWWS